MLYEQILVATDGGAPARAATKEAITFAKHFGATLHAVYVLKAAEPPPDVEDPALKPGIDTHAEEAIQAVVTEAAETGLESEVVEAVLRGRTAHAIISYTEEHDIDLIVTGTHGRSGIDRLVLGSVAEHIMRESPVPVLTVRDDDKSK